MVHFTLKIYSLVIFQPEVGVPLAVSDLSGVRVTPSPQAWEGVVASEASSTLTTLEKNAAQGAAFEQKVGNDLVKAGDINIEPQITIKADNGVRTRLILLVQIHLGKYL